MADLQVPIVNAGLDDFYNKSGRFFHLSIKKEIQSNITTWNSNKKSAVLIFKIHQNCSINLHAFINLPKKWETSISKSLENLKTHTPLIYLNDSKQL